MAGWTAGRGSWFGVQSLSGRPHVRAPVGAPKEARSPRSPHAEVLRPNAAVGWDAREEDDSTLSQYMAARVKHPAELKVRCLPKNCPPMLLFQSSRNKRAPPPGKLQNCIKVSWRQHRRKDAIHAVLRGHRPAHSQMIDRRRRIRYPRQTCAPRGTGQAALARA